VSADQPVRGRSAPAAWRAFGHAFAAAAGALVALIGCLAHVPPWVACLRGLATWAAARAVVGVADRMLPRERRAAAGAPAGDRR
jgi:hypothetical protein